MFTLVWLVIGDLPSKFNSYWRFSVTSYLGIFENSNQHRYIKAKNHTYKEGISLKASSPFKKKSLESPLMNDNCTVVDVRDNVCTAPVNTYDITGIHQSISLTSRIYMIIKQWVWETAAKEDKNTQQNPVFKRYYQTHTCTTKKYILKHDGIFETNGKFAKKNNTMHLC